MRNVFDWKVIRARLSRSQALTHLAALSIAMELVAMAAEKVLTATQRACCALRASERPCVSVLVPFFVPLLSLCAGPCVCCVSRHRYDCVRSCVHVRCGVAAEQQRFDIRRCFTAAALVLFVLWSLLTRSYFCFRDQLCKVAHRM